MYRPADVLTVNLARVLRDGERVFHGLASPVPMVAVLLAKSLHAPHLVHLSIAGAVDPKPESLPASTIDGKLTAKARAYFPLTDIFDLSARGDLDTAFLSGVQIDGSGRINLSVIGSFHRPRVRLPGGAGSAALIPTAGRVILWRARHDRRSLVEELDFITAAGRVEYLATPLALFRRAGQGFRLEGYSCLATPEEVRELTGFTYEDSGAVALPPPREEELAALRAVDPEDVRSTEFR